MPTSYIFDAALNLHKCFQNSPPSTIKIDDLPQLPKDWLIELESKCREIKLNLEKNIFSSHVGQHSKYKLKTELLEQLSLIYYQISGHLCSGLLNPESNKLILLELMEDIEQCTPGFHIRVNKLVNSLQVPQNLEQLLYLVRKNIIQEIAVNLTASVPAIYQVHVADRVIRIAQKQGLGIQPNIQRDRYKSLLPGSSIRERLENEFPKHYTAFKIPFLLAEQLQLILTQSGYTGPNENYYNSDTAENIVSVIRKNFSSSNIQKLHFKEFFILHLDQFDTPTLLYDIDWSLIRQFFFQKLTIEDFISEPKATNLIEYAYFRRLMPEKHDVEAETNFIKLRLTQEDYATLIDELSIIQGKFPDYWHQLIRNRLIINNIDQFFKFLKEQSRNIDNAKELLKKLNLTYTLLFSQTNEFILCQIFVESERNLAGINHNLLLKSVRYRPEVTRESLKIIFNNRNDFYLFFDLLLKQNNEGSNLLMLAARYDLSTLQHILNLLSLHEDRIEKEKISKLFMSQNKDGWNMLSLAARHQSSSMQSIFDFIRENPFYLDNEILTNIFNQKINAEWNFLQLLVRYRSEEELNKCLNFISEKFQRSNNKNWLEIVLNKENTGCLLRLAAQSNQSALNGILNFMSKHIQQIDTQTLHHFFLEPNNKGWHCLHSAAFGNASNLKLILAFIQQHIDQFDADFLSILFLAKNKMLHSFLHLAVYYQPADSIERIFKFLSQHIKFFNTASLQQLLLQQNFDGWNCLSAAYLHSASIKIILEFINDHFDKFDAETIKQIILQKNKYHYNCLHLTARFQPDSLKIILNFIDQHFDDFSHELKLLFQIDKLRLITMLFRKKNNQAKNLLDLSLKYQPESAAHFSRFLNTHTNSFNLENTCFKNFINQTANKALLTEASFEAAMLGQNNHQFNFGN